MTTSTQLPALHLSHLLQAIELKDSVMAKYRDELPQLESRLFVTDGGIITTLIYKRKIDLPYLATFPLLDDPKGREELRLFAREYIDVARRYGHGIILDTATWRANPDWGAKLNYGSDKLRAANEKSDRTSLGAAGRT